MLRIAQSAVPVDAAAARSTFLLTHLADAFFGLLHVAVSPSGAVNHAPHLGVHGIPLERVHGLGAHLIVDGRVQHRPVRQLRLLGQVLERPGERGARTVRNRRISATLAPRPRLAADLTRGTVLLIN